MSNDKSGVAQQLYAIDCKLHGILNALTDLAPQGSERERIALRIFSLGDFDALDAFDFADAFIAQRDKQRAQQAE